MVALGGPHRSPKGRLFDFGDESWRAKGTPAQPQRRHRPQHMRTHPRSSPEGAAPAAVAARCTREAGVFCCIVSVARGLIQRPVHPLTCASLLVRCSLFVPILSPMPTVDHVCMRLISVRGCVSEGVLVLLLLGCAGGCHTPVVAYTCWATQDMPSKCGEFGEKAGRVGGGTRQTAHPATSRTAPAHQRRGSANAETTRAGAPAAAADRKQRLDATCEGKNG